MRWRTARTAAPGQCQRGRVSAGLGPRLWAVTRLAGHTGAVADVAYSPDGQHLASTGTDETVRVWDLATGQSHTLTGHTEPVWAVAYSPDGQHLASAGYDGLVWVWVNAGMTPTEAIDLICRSYGRDLTPDQRETYLPSTASDLRACPTPTR